jgi:hypothetical protein
VTSLLLSLTPFKRPPSLGSWAGRSAIPAIHLGADQSRRAPGAPE